MTEQQADRLIGVLERIAAALEGRPGPATQDNQPAAVSVRVLNLSSRARKVVNRIVAGRRNVDVAAVRHPPNLPTLEEVTRLCAEEILDTRDAGKVTLAEIRMKLAERALKLAGD